MHVGAERSTVVPAGRRKTRSAHCASGVAQFLEGAAGMVEALCKRKDCVRLLFSGAARSFDGAGLAHEAAGRRPGAIPVDQVKVKDSSAG